MSERWLPIPGYEGKYEVSDLGRVRSLDRQWMMRNRWGTLQPYSMKGRILRPGRSTQIGHVSVVLGHKTAGRCVHELVMLAFVGPRPANHDIRHLNGVPDDNRLCNLAYATRSENNRDIARHNRRKLTVQQVRSLRREREAGASLSALSAKYGVCPSQVSNVANRRHYAHIDD